MPKGVYPRTQNQLRASVANLAKGREPEARGKARDSLARIAKDPKWRDRVSEGTRAAMHRPDIRARHLQGLRGAMVNFKGGNGQPMTPVVTQAAAILEPLGFIRELVIRTRGHGTAESPPRNYKADFGNPKTKMVIELDGPSHSPYARKLLDRKKDKVLAALGWKIIRVPHS